MKGFKVGFYVL